MPIGTFDLGVIAIYFLVIIFIGYHSMKRIRNFSDYAVAGRGIPLALLFASAGVLHHAGIKVPFFAFFAHYSGIRTAEAPRNMLLAMILAGGFAGLAGLLLRHMDRKMRDRGIKTAYTIARAASHGMNAVFRNK